VAFGVFIHRSDSIYEDSPAERYQFPSQYLARVAVDQPHPHFLRWHRENCFKA
jgi:hypothetical protein